MGRWEGTRLTLNCAHFALAGPVAGGWDVGQLVPCLACPMPEDMLGRKRYAVRQIVATAAAHAAERPAPIRHDHGYSYWG